MLFDRNNNNQRRFWSIFIALSVGLFFVAVGVGSNVYQRSLIGDDITKRISDNYMWTFEDIRDVEQNTALGHWIDIGPMLQDVLDQLSNEGKISAACMIWNYGSPITTHYVRVYQTHSARPSGGAAQSTSCHPE
jgi:hypothetical protein